jgi:hypothetical protein
MKKLWIVIAAAAALGVGGFGVSRALAGSPPSDPDLKKKIVPIITVGSSLNVGVAQVSGEERDVNRCKAVAQLETDYKDVARIKILVPVQSQKVVQHIDRVPGVSVTAIADYAIKK